MYIYEANHDKVDNEIKLRFEILENTFHLSPNIQRTFFDDGEILVSTSKRKIISEKHCLYGREIHGLIFRLNDQERKMVVRIEREHNIKVYHVIKSNYADGVIYSLFYVSEYEEEWALDREDLNEGYPLVYCENQNNPQCSEFGSIAIKEADGGLVRIS